VLEIGRSVVMVVDGDCESHLGVFNARTERGLRVTAFDKTWTEVVRCTCACVCVCLDGLCLQTAF
jgi:hypothetical protein